MLGKLGAWHLRHRKPAVLGWGLADAGTPPPGPIGCRNGIPAGLDAADVRKSARHGQ